MTRYYLEVRYQVTPTAGVDEHTDAMMDALDLESSLIDPDVGANLRSGWADVCAVVDSEDETSALRAGLAAIRSVAHRADTSGWKADLDNVMATVRPAGLDLEDYSLPVQSTGHPSESVSGIEVEPGSAVQRTGSENQH